MLQVRICKTQSLCMCFVVQIENQPDGPLSSVQQKGPKAAPRMILWTVPYFEYIEPVNVQESPKADLSRYRKTGTSPTTNKNNQA